LVCKSCNTAANLYQDDYGATSCKPCSTGVVFGSGVGCGQCNVGTFFDAITSVCVPCPVGTEQPAIGQQGCSACAPDSFMVALDIGTPNCHLCPQGSIFINGSHCMQCAPGSFDSDTPQNRGKQCTPCPRNTYSTEYGVYGSTCTPCDAGYTTVSYYTGIEDPEDENYWTPHGNTECRQCTPGSYFTVVGFSFCQGCDRGYISTIHGATECTPCAKGEYTEHMFTNTECTKCPIDTSSSAGSISEADCTCISGYFRAV
jgi:hypothetical protein